MMNGVQGGGGGTRGEKELKVVSKVNSRKAHVWKKTRALFFEKWG